MSINREKPSSLSLVTPRRKTNTKEVEPNTESVVRPPPSQESSFFLNDLTADISAPKKDKKANKLSIIMRGKVLQGIAEREEQDTEEMKDKSSSSYSPTDCDETADESNDDTNLFFSEFQKALSSLDN